MTFFHHFPHKEVEAQRSSLIFQNLLKYKPGYKLHRALLYAVQCYFRMSQSMRNKANAEDIPTT